MENEITVEKRKRITKPYKTLCAMWRKIAIGLIVLCGVLGFLLIQAMRVIK